MIGHIPMPLLRTSHTVGSAQFPTNTSAGFPWLMHAANVAANVTARDWLTCWGHLIGLSFILEWIHKEELDMSWTNPYWGTQYMMDGYG